MDFAKTFDKLESKYYGEWEEDRATLVKNLNEIRDELESSPEQLTEFYFRVINYFGGAYIPYVFWTKLSRFMEHPMRSGPSCRRL